MRSLWPTLRRCGDIGHRAVRVVLRREQARMAVRIARGNQCTNVVVGLVGPKLASVGSCRRLHLLGKPLFTLPGLQNSALLALGAVAIDPARRRSDRVSAKKRA